MDFVREPADGAGQPSDGAPRLHRLQQLALDREHAGTLRVLAFFGHRAPAGDAGAPGPWMLSQWWPCPFEDGTHTYRTAEHYMMAKKAGLFSDSVALARVLAAPDPKTAKAAGRDVRGFDEAVWQAHRYDIVCEGTRLKFTQHPDALAFLLGTHGRLLVEASPYDRIWGIGLPVSDQDCNRPSRWRGLNLLGYALTDVREELAGAAGV